MKCLLMILSLLCGACGVAHAQEAPASKDQTFNVNADAVSNRIAGFVETLDPKTVLMSLSFRWPHAANGQLGALIVNEPVRKDGTFTLTKTLPKEFSVETVPDKCIPLKTLIVGDETVVSQILTATAGITQSRTNLNVQIGSLSIAFSSNERFKGIERQAMLAAPKWLFANILLRERNGGITFGCPGSDSKEASK